MHLGHDFKSPFKESDPRHVAPNFYFAFEVCFPASSKSPYNVPANRAVLHGGERLTCTMPLALQDYLQERVAKGVSWKWSILRPGAILGYSPGTVMSLLQVLAVYGTFCREYNLPLRSACHDCQLKI